MICIHSKHCWFVFIFDFHYFIILKKIFSFFYYCTDFSLLKVIQFYLTVLNFLSLCFINTIYTLAQHFLFLMMSNIRVNICSYYLIFVSFINFIFFLLRTSGFMSMSGWMAFMEDLAILEVRKRKMNLIKLIKIK